MQISIVYIFLCQLNSLHANYYWCVYKCTGQSIHVSINFFDFSKKWIRIKNCHTLKKHNGLFNHRWMRDHNTVNTICQNSKSITYEQIINLSSHSIPLTYIFHGFHGWKMLVKKKCFWKLIKKYSSLRNIDFWRNIVQWWIWFEYIRVRIPDLNWNNWYNNRIWKRIGRF